MPALVAIALGMALVAACGGRLSLPGLVLSRSWYALVVLYVLQGLARGRLLGAIGLGELGLMIWALLATLLAVVCWMNASQPGIALLGAGSAANVLVVLVNGGMPFVAPGGEGPSDSFYHAASAADRLIWLADVLPAPGGFLVSLGDVLMLIAVVVVIVHSGVAAPFTDNELSHSSGSR